MTPQTIGIAGFVVMVAMILIESGMECFQIIFGKKSAACKEAPFVMTRLTEEQA